MVRLTLPGAVREQLDGVAAAESLRTAAEFGPFISENGLAHWLVFHQRSLHKFSIAVFAWCKL